MSRNAFYRLGIAATIVTTAFLVLGIGALGIIGAGGENDRMYVVVPAVLVVGAAVARLRARGMAATLASAALAMVVVALVAFARGLHSSPGASVGEILMLTAMYSGLFLAAAYLFWRAAGQDRAPSVAGRR